VRGQAFLIVVIEGMGMWMAALGIAKSFCWGYYALMNQRNPWEAKDYDKRNNQAKNESSRY
jgi:hypothetical protein